MSVSLTPRLEKRVLQEQQNELNAHHIYSRLSRRIKDTHNREIMEHIARDELAHYNYLATVSGKTLKPQRLKIFWFFFITRFLGLTFGIKLLEKAEEHASGEGYADLYEPLPEVKAISEQEDRHERELIGMIEEERLNYMGSVVLGLNDALVELTGALAGLSFALQNTKLIALSGLITGIAASFSMAASEYLSTKAEGGENAAKSSLYTGLAYIVTVFLLVLPYFFFTHYLICLFITLGISVLIILMFNYYISVAQDKNFLRRFSEMVVISLGVAALSFGISIIVKMFFDVEIG